MKTIIALLLITSNVLAFDIKDNVLLCIKRIEGSRTGQKVLDSNNRYSYGSFQIQEAYLKDANEYLGTSYTIDQVTHSDVIATKVVIGYLTRYSNYYSRITGKYPDDKLLLMMHNGGGTIWKRSSSKAFLNASRYAERAMSLRM